MTSLNNLFFKDRIKKSLFIAATIICLLISMIYGYYRVTATSAFDNNYQTVNNIDIHGPSPFNVCTDIDNSGNWYSVFQAAVAADTHFFSQGTLDTYQDTLANNVVNGVGSWGVTEAIATNGERDYIIIFSAQDGATIDFNGNDTRLTRSGGGATDLYRVRIRNKRWHTGAGACTYYIVELSRVQTFVLSNSGGTFKNAFYGGNFNVTYPTGYSGKAIKQVFTPPNTYYPDFSFNVDGLSLRAQYTGNVPYDEPQLTSLRWRVVQQVQGQYTNVVNDIELDEIETFQYQFAETGNYEVWLDYLIATPGQLPPPDTLATRVQRLKIDGSSYTATSSEQECNAGVCQAPSIYEDCTTFGTNVVGGLGCQFRNFGVFLKGILVSLFVPDSIFIKNYFNELQTFFTEKFGLLAYPVTFLSDATGTIISEAATPDCTIDTPGTFMGANADLNLCLFEESMPTVWTPLVTFIRASTIFALMLALYRKFVAILKGREEPLE